MAQINKLILLLFLMLLIGTASGSQYAYITQSQNDNQYTSLFTVGQTFTTTGVQTTVTGFSMNGSLPNGAYIDAYLETSDFMTTLGSVSGYSQSGTTYTFNFANPITVNPSTQYFLLLNINNIGHRILIARYQSTDVYAGGNLYQNGISEAGQDLQFVVYGNGTAGGIGIDGIVYEYINGVNTPVPGSTIFIYNSTWSDTQVTGSDGYYLFNTLNNSSTYYLTASKKDYITTAIQTVTTGLGIITTHNILIKQTEPTFFEPDRQYVKFIVRDIFGQVFPNTTTNVYIGSSAIISQTGTTDQAGEVSFYLFKTQSYRMTFTNPAFGISASYTIVPVDTTYYIIVSKTQNTWQQYPTPMSTGITTDITKGTIDATNAWITVSYLDSLSQTTSLTININQSNASGSSSQTNIASWTCSDEGGCNDISHNFTIAGYNGQSYFVNIIFGHTTYGQNTKGYVVIFPKQITVSGIPDIAWLFVAVCIMVFTAAIFTSTSAEIGFIIVCGEGWLFWLIGWFNSSDPNKIAIGLTIASFIGVVAYISKQGQRNPL